MKHGTGIEWTHVPGYKGETWNPIVGCSVVSPGCTNCYAMGLAGTRLKNVPAYAGLTDSVNGNPVWTGETRLLAERLDQPLRWRNPRAIFVNSMGDLFHEGVPDEWIDKVFAVAELSRRHLFIVLTKRSARMRAYFADARAREKAVWSEIADLGSARDLGRPLGNWWPLANVWLGVSAEDQRRADERIPDLLATPAAVRFVSVEPMLGPIDLTNITARTPGGPEQWDALDRAEAADAEPGAPDTVVDWVICGGESGKSARPMHPGWARRLRDQCYGTPFFFKQWGEFDPIGARVGKKAAGHLLDGAAHHAWPAP